MSPLIDALKGLQKRMETVSQLRAAIVTRGQDVAAQFSKQLSEIIAEHERSAEPVKCKCGSEPNADHPCPYKSEINDNSEDLCNCCDDCRHNCCMDI